MSSFFNFNVISSDQNNESTLCDVSLKTRNFTKGHFPDREILPAYSLTFMCSEFLSEKKNIKLNNYTIKSSKFSSPVDPLKIIQLSFNTQNNEKFNFVVSQENTVCAKLTLMHS